MKSAAYYFSVSPPLIKENLRRYWAIPAISFLVYFLTGLFPILISYMDLSYSYYFIDSMLKNQYAPFMLVHLFAPVLAGVSIFRYLQATPSVTSLHAMPFTRASLFNSNVLSGLILLTLPIILTGTILLAIAKPAYNTYYTGIYEGVELINAFERMNIVSWMWESFIIILFIYAITVFAALVTGNSLMHIFAGFGFNFMLPGFFGTLTIYCTQFLYGFTVNTDWVGMIVCLSPYLAVVSLGGEFPWTLQLIYILSAVAVLAVSMLLYYRRKLERASDSFVFGFMIPTMTYLIAFFGMSMMGLYFYSIGYNESYLYAGLLSGTLVFFLIGRAIVKKTFRIFNKKTAQSLGVYLLLASLFVAAFALDLTGFEKRLPDERRVNGAAVSSYPLFSTAHTPGADDSLILTSESNLSAIRGLHRDIFENYRGYELSESRYRYNIYCTFHYDLTGLFDMHREYSLDYGYAISSGYLAEIYESEEYKSLFSPATIDLRDVTSLTLSHPLTYDSNMNIMITGRSKIREFLKNVDLDFKAQTYREAMSFVNPYAEVSFDYRAPGPDSYPRYYSTYRIPRTYKNSIEWLKKNGYGERLEIPPELISQMAFTKWNNWESPAHTVEITDPAQIALILDTYENTTYTKEFYEGTLTLDPEIAGEYPNFGIYYRFYYSDETVPYFIKAAL